MKYINSTISPLRHEFWQFSTLFPISQNCVLFPPENLVLSQFARWEMNIVWNLSFFQIFTWSSLMTVQIKGITFSTKATQIYHLKGTASKLLQTSSLFKVTKIYSQLGDIAQTWPGHLRKDILGTKLCFGIFYLCPSSLWFSGVRIMILDTV